MKQAFIKKRFHRKIMAQINNANAIIESYKEQGYRLTLRQLYYQFVSRNWLENKERSYKNLGNVISEARLCGLIDWDAIEDRVRVPRRSSEWNSIQELVDSAVWSYRLPRWNGQKNYVELWVEKDALAGVISPLASEFHVTMMVNRGYSSQSAMFEAAQRFLAQGGKTCHLLYLGDHDPSGEDMVRDIRERLEMFGCTVEVEKLALTMGQVKQYNPPPNPAKMSDSRAPGYVSQHGQESWEVDALPPDVLAKLIREALSARVDMKLMEEIKAQEIKDRDSLRLAAQQIGKTAQPVTEPARGVDPVERLRWKMHCYQSE